MHIEKNVAFLFSPSLPSCDNVNGKFSINARVGSINLIDLKYVWNLIFVSSR